MILGDAKNSAQFNLFTKIINKPIQRNNQMNNLFLFILQTSCFSNYTKTGKKFFYINHKYEYCWTTSSLLQNIV